MAARRTQDTKNSLPARLGGCALVLALAATVGFFAPASSVGNDSELFAAKLVLVLDTDPGAETTGAEPLTSAGGHVGDALAHVGWAPPDRLVVCSRGAERRAVAEPDVRRPLVRAPKTSPPARS